jgi:hypothetical protein
MSRLAFRLRSSVVGVLVFDVICAVAVVTGEFFNIFETHQQDAYLVLVLGLYGGSFATVVAICQLDLAYTYQHPQGKPEAPDLYWRPCCVSTKDHRGNTAAWPYWEVVISAAPVFIANAAAVRDDCGVSRWLWSYSLGGLSEKCAGRLEKRSSIAQCRRGGAVALIGRGTRADLVGGPDTNTQPDVAEPIAPRSARTLCMLLPEL